MTNDLFSAAYEIPDSSWVCSAFIVSDGPQWDYEQERRYYSTADRKVTSSALGEGRVINMPPAPSALADIPISFGISGERDHTGTGVFYNEILDDNLDIIHIRPGKPRFSSLSRFYLNAMQHEAIQGADYGWFLKTVNAIASGIGYILKIPFTIVGSAWDVLHSAMSNDDTNRYSYYYLAPATYAYWRAVDNIVNDFSLRSGLLPGAAYNGPYQDGGRPNKELSDADIEWFKKHIPGVYRSTFLGLPRIDVIAIACRYSIMQARREDYLAKKLDATFQPDFNEDYMAKWEQIMLTHNPWGADESARSLEGVQKVGNALFSANNAMREQYNRIIHADMSEVLTPPGAPKAEIEVDKESGAVDTKYVVDTVVNLLGASEESQETIGRVAPEMDDVGFTSSFKEVVKGGADWISFAVDQVTESKITITNESGPSGLADMINGMVSASRTAQFNIAGGNFGDGVTATLVENTISTAKAALNGLTSTFVGGMPAAIMGGKAFIDIPDVYQGSQMEFEQMSYSITSTSVSGHPLAKLRMLMPYFCLLALAAPQSGGPSSYCPPFLVECQHKGRGIVQLGMVDSLTATFGEEDGWDINDIPNMVKIDFSIVNLSKGFHIPIDPDASMTYRDTGAFCLHMSVLAGTALTDRDRSLGYNLKRKAMRLVGTVDRTFSANTWGMIVGSNIRSMFSGPLALAGVYNNRR